MSDIVAKIPPTASIVRYLKETLDLTKLRKSGKKTYDGSTVGTIESQEIKLRIRNNDDAKTRAIDNLFESMANLIHFFEFVNNHPELADKYSNDIRDLLDNPFHRLIAAIIGEGDLSDFEDRKLNYRYRLLKTIQFLINQKAMQYYANPDNPTNKKDIRFKDLVWSDLLRSELWLTNMDKFTIDKNRNPGRIMGF
jgi:hypothetical protein